MANVEVAGSSQPKPRIDHTSLSDVDAHAFACRCSFEREAIFYRSSVISPHKPHVDTTSSSCLVCPISHERYPHHGNEAVQSWRQMPNRCTLSWSIRYKKCLKLRSRFCHVDCPRRQAAGLLWRPRGRETFSGVIFAHWLRGLVAYALEMTGLRFVFVSGFDKPFNACVFNV